VIVDFGLATFCDIETYIYNKCGTPGFVPPEIITQKEPAHVEPLCDIFSLGALFHILLTRKQLFEGTSFQEVLHKNKHLMIKVNETVVKKTDLNALDLLKKMIEVNPADRISADEALSHPFFTAMEEEKATATNL
jgi:calcium-dependent protein kinase